MQSRFAGSDPAKTTKQPREAEDLQGPTLQYIAKGLKISGMPSKNIVKIYDVDTYYHIYNRGVNKRVIFIDQTDYATFLNLLKRHLSPEPVKDTSGREYPNYSGEISLHAFCLMPNHFHLLVHQTTIDAITKLLRSVATSYTMYFNKKYKRVGHLFQERYKASNIQTDAYLQHISRYIHLNPEDYKHWDYSSLPYYLGNMRAQWIHPQPILELFEGDDYSAFVEDYKSHRDMLKEIKSSLADS